jgi:hypothetical protein
MVTLFNIRHPREGLGWIQRVVEIAGDISPLARSRLLADASFAATNIGDLHSMVDYARAAVDAGGEEAPATVWIVLASWHDWNADHERAVELSRQAIDLAGDDDTLLFLAMLYLVSSLGGIGDESGVRELAPGLIALARRLASPTFLAVACSITAESFLLLGHATEAAAFYDEALAVADAGGPQTAAAARSSAALASDDPRRVVELMRAALPIARDHLAGFHQTNQLVAAARAAHTLGRHREAAELLGAYQRGLEIAGVRGREFYRRPMVAILSSLASVLTPDDLAMALEQGRQLTGDQAIHFAISAVGDRADAR